MSHSPLRFFHYRVLDHPDGGPWRLGAGAMGETYKAYDERLRLVEEHRTWPPDADAFYIARLER